MADGDLNVMTPAAMPPHRGRRWLDIRWIMAGVVVGTIVFLAWGLFGPEPAVRVSRETTFITEPLAADGLPDYRAALLAMAGPAPPPEDNAAATLLQVFWPLGIDAADLPAVCAALGIPSEPPSEPLRVPHEDAVWKVTVEDYDAGLERPWTGEELPALEAWLVANEVAIDQVVVATKRPRYWLPSPSLLGSTEGLLFGLDMPDLQQLRNAARILVCRAQWHIGEGRHAEAWQDILATYRLSHLLAAPECRYQCLVTRLISVAIQATADGVVLELLNREMQGPDLLANVCRDLDGLGPSGTLAEAMLWERFGVVDAIVYCARRNQGGRAGRVELFQGTFDSQVLSLLRTSLDWNDVLRRVNEEHDTIKQAMRLPTVSARRAVLDRAGEDLVAKVGAWNDAVSIPMLLCNRGARSALVAWYTSSLFTPSFSSVLNADARGQSRFMLTRTSAALAMWRVDRGSPGAEYPERLEDLVPRYLSAVPIDPFSDKPLIYERRGDGYLLASVGDNGVYDGGDDWSGRIIGGNWQEEERDVPRNASDLVVRMPMPIRPVVINPSTP